MEGVLFLILSMSLVLLLIDRWESNPLPLIARYFIISSIALFSFNAIISQSKTYWFQEMMREQYILFFVAFLLLEIALGILFSRFSDHKAVQKLIKIASFIPRPTTVFSILLIEILVFDAVHGWSFKTVGITYAIGVLILGISTYFLFRNQKSVVKIKTVIVTVFSLLQLLLICTLYTPQKLDSESNTSFDIQSSVFVLTIFFGFALVGYLLSIRKNDGLRQ